MFNRLYYVPLKSSSLTQQAQQINTIVEATVEFDTTGSCPAFIPSKANIIMYVLYRDGIHMKQDGDVEGVQTVNVRSL